MANIPVFTDGGPMSYDAITERYTCCDGRVCTCAPIVDEEPVHELPAAPFEKYCSFCKRTHNAREFRALKRCRGGLYQRDWLGEDRSREWRLCSCRNTLTASTLSLDAGERYLDEQSRGGR